MISALQKDTRSGGALAEMPRIGLGTWRIGEPGADRARQVAAIRHAVELGYRLFDTAEMYGDGGAECVLGKALGDAVRAGDVDRASLFVVSKIYPYNASRHGVAAACKQSLERMELDRIDLYLLHWRGHHPLQESVDAFERLCSDGLIGRWGVSNFDVKDMQDLFGVDGGTRCAANQIYLSLSERGAEHSLLPWLRRMAVTVMAYSPVNQGSLASAAALLPMATRLQATPAQIALAWLLGHHDLVAIPKALQPAHQRDNFSAQQLRLSPTDRQELDNIFPPPVVKRPLAMI